MSLKHDNNWMKSNSRYSEQQINSILQELSIEIVGETDSVFLCLCPMHKNTDTPSFAVNKENGSYICFSPMCDVQGSLMKLVMDINDITIFPAKRFIAKHENTSMSTSAYVQKIFSEREELPKFSQDLINKMSDEFWDSSALDYMRSRGFSDSTLAYFQVGFSKNKRLVVVPVHDWQGTPVGVIGRTIVGKRFENSAKLPTKKTMFNLHRAKKIGEKVIIVESTFDAMKIHQAGFPNVIATCGGFFTDDHHQLIDRYFNEIIIMTDNDNPEEHRSVYCKKCENTCRGHSPGRALGEKIYTKMHNKRIKWASYEYGIIYPHEAKDVGDMTEQEIKQCIENAVSHAGMLIWRKEIPRLAII